MWGGAHATCPAMSATGSNGLRICEIVKAPYANIDVHTPLAPLDCRKWTARPKQSTAYLTYRMATQMQRDR